MASAKAVTWLIIFVSILAIVASQKQLKQQTTGPPSFEYNKICKSIYSNSIESLMKLRNCTVVVGNLRIQRLERTKTWDFTNISFPELREVTGYVLVYRAKGVYSLGKLFPNLGRIRGSELVYNYALIVFEMPDLVEIGLYGLLKIDRGGVTLWGGVLTCYMDTIRWDLITNGRHIMYPPDTYPNCNVYCSCSRDPSWNFCWNNKKCQLYLEGPEADHCDSECLGCKKKNSKECSLCRNYTYRNQCVSECPNGTIVLPANKYCITEKECDELDGWSWNNTCLFGCPQNYIEVHTTNGTTCNRCDNCKQTCRSLVIHALADVQSAERCVFINGSLTISIRTSLPEALNEMRQYLSVIQEVSDYINIYGSISISSLEFLSSLQRIRGRNLLNGKYSLAVSGLHNLQTLFTPNVTENLKVDKGTLMFYDNPMLCMSEIDRIKNKFPEKYVETDVPPGMNGYSGGCTQVFLQLKVEVQNETSAVAIFNRTPKLDVQYSVLYVLIPQGSHTTFVPETCSESEWNAICVPHSKLKDYTVRVELTSLRPASSYALCIETYDPVNISLARSSIVHFSTAVGKPEPPFITELVASSSEVIVIRWVDHKDYRPHIIHYELDVNLVEIAPNDIVARDHCVPVSQNSLEVEFSRHAVVMRPPKNYERACESMCGLLSSVPIGAIFEEYFDVCSALESGCDEYDDSTRSRNSSIGSYVKSLVLNLSSPRTDFQVGNLAPFRDYRFRLRACTADKCSRYRNGVVRTLRSERADVPYIISVGADAAGFIGVQWRPPKETNGPLLAYYIEIVPVVPDMEKLFPRVWCVPGNVTNHKVKYDIAKKYSVRICSTTLGTNYICSSTRDVVIPSENELSIWWWIGFPIALILYVYSLLLGWILKRRRRSDETLLVEASVAFLNESEPPCPMILYSVPFESEDP